MKSLSDQVTTCYANNADKRIRFVRETVPAILASARAQAELEEYTLGRWMFRHRVLTQENPWDMLQALHNAARQGTYRTTKPAHCDRTQTAARTLMDGGDCDQWAAVLMACCTILGLRATLCAFGDPLADKHGDPYRHVGVVVEIGSQSQVYLDPKGSQAGADFNEWPPKQYELTGAWR